MIVRAITVHVNEKDIDAFKEATAANHRGSIQEPGILRFDVLQNAERPTEFLLYEVYRSQEATERHKETEHYKVWKETVEPMMTGDRQRTAYTVVAPTDEAAW
ncbi:MAG: antibiotic biosynthesis monooxygenase [Spirochaetota bacterium]